MNGYSSSLKIFEIVGWIFPQYSHNPGCCRNEYLAILFYACGSITKVT